jgi:hypothetical protein
MMYLSGGKYLWRNDNLAGIPLVSGWDSISTNWVKWADSIPVANVKISCITPCKTPANRVYLGTNSRKLYKIDNANTGTPKPVDITSTTSGNVFPGAANINCVAVDPRDGNKLMVVFSNYNVYSIFYSSDGGSSWSKQGGNLEPADGSGPSVRWAAIIPVSDGVIYLLATSTGLYATTTLAGANTVWVQQGSNTIGNAVCDMIDFRTNDGTVVVATHANGIFSATYTTVNNIVSTQNFNPPQIKLYPNPTNDNIVIQNTEKYQGSVLVEILDNCGRIIQTENIQDSNGKEIEIALKPGAKGTYYCHIFNNYISKTLAFIRN